MLASLTNEEVKNFNVFSFLVNIKVIGIKKTATSNLVMAII